MVAERQDVADGAESTTTQSQSPDRQKAGNGCAGQVELMQEDRVTMETN